MEDEPLPWFLEHPIKTPRDVADYLEEYLKHLQADNAWVRIDDLDQWCSLSHNEKGVIQKVLNTRVKARKGIDSRVYVYKRDESYALPGQKKPPYEYWIGTSKKRPGVYMSRMREYLREKDRQAKILQQKM